MSCYFFEIITFTLKRQRKIIEGFSSLLCGGPDFTYRNISITSNKENYQQFAALQVFKQTRDYGMKATHNRHLICHYAAIKTS